MTGNLRKHAVDTIMAEMRTAYAEAQRDATAQGDLYVAVGGAAWTAIEEWLAPMLAFPVPEALPRDHATLCGMPIRRSSKPGFGYAVIRECTVSEDWQ